MAIKHQNIVLKLVGDIMPMRDLKITPNLQEFAQSAEKNLVIQNEEKIKLNFVPLNVNDYHCMEN